MNEGQPIFRHRQLEVWHAAMSLAMTVHHMIEPFPKEERFGLYSQISRTSVSVPSNIAEGASRRSPADFAHFLGIARGALAELDTQLELADAFGFLSYTHERKEEIAQLARRMNALVRRLTVSAQTNQPISQSANQPAHG